MSVSRIPVHQQKLFCKCFKTALWVFQEEMVDIETVEELQQGIAISKMKEAAAKALQASR